MPKIIKKEGERAVRLSFSIPQEMKDLLEKKAKGDLRTVSGYIKKILTEHLEK